LVRVDYVRLGRFRGLDWPLFTGDRCSEVVVFTGLTVYYLGEDLKKNPAVNHLKSIFYLLSIQFHLVGWKTFKLSETILWLGRRHSMVII
jgi:hypothetical protein